MPVTALITTFITDMANAPDAPHGYYLSPTKASATASTSLCVVLPLIPVIISPCKYFGTPHE